MSGLIANESAEMAPSGAPVAAEERVLTSGTGMDGRMAVVQHGDGTLAITFPQHPDRGELRWPAQELDDCMHAYLCLLRRRTPEG